MKDLPKIWLLCRSRDPFSCYGKLAEKMVNLGNGEGPRVLCKLIITGQIWFGNIQRIFKDSTSWIKATGDQSFVVSVCPNHNCSSYSNRSS